MNSNQEFAESLRQIADLYENNPDFPQPNGAFFEIYNCDDKEILRKAIRAMGKAEKNFYDSSSPTSLMEISRTFGNIKVTLRPYRSTVCERKVVGTKTVVEQVPVTFKEVEKEVELVEWECAPLMEAS